MDELYWFSLNFTITTIDTVSPLQGNQSRPCNFIHYIFIELDQQLECMKHLQYLRGPVQYS